MSPDNGGRDKLFFVTALFSFGQTGSYTKGEKNNKKHKLLSADKIMLELLRIMAQLKLTLEASLKTEEATSLSTLPKIQMTFQQYLVK